MADVLQRSAYSSYRKYDPKMECNFIDSWMEHGAEEVVEDDVDSLHADLHADLAEWKPEQREKLLTNLTEKLIPLHDSPGYAEDIVLQGKKVGEHVPTVAVMADGYVKNHRLLEMEYRVLHEAYKTIQEKIGHDAVIQRHSLEMILQRAELFMRNRRLGVEGDGFDFEQKRKAAFNKLNDKAAFDFTPEKRSKIARRRADDNKARSATLNMLLNRFFQKLGPDADGDITVLPEGNELADLSKFESSLYTMAKPKLSWYLDTHGCLPFDVAEQMMVDCLAVGSSIDESGEVVLQKMARRCNYKKPSSSFKRPKYEPKDELAECSFTPRIGRKPAPSLYRSRSVALKRDARLTSWQRKELQEMEECTFQPNLHKGIGATGTDGSAPQHRPFRRDAQGFLREFEKKPVATGTNHRMLPGPMLVGDAPAGAWEWSLRSSSVPPGGSETPAYLAPNEQDMQFGNSSGLTESMKKEKHLRDWSTHVRLSSSHMEVIRRPEGDQAVKQFAKRFLELRAAEQFKMQTVKRECQTNLGFKSRS
jgi:hypothetical protein